MNAISRAFSKFLKAGTLLTTLALLITVIIQVYGRFLMKTAPAWTEEASRIFFIYAISFASGLAYKQNYFVFLDLITAKTGSQAESILRNISEFAAFVLFGTMTVVFIIFIKIGYTETSPSLGINMSFAFASMLIMSVSISFFAGSSILKRIRKQV